MSQVLCRTSTTEQGTCSMIDLLMKTTYSIQKNPQDPSESSYILFQEIKTANNKVKTPVGLCPDIISAASMAISMTWAPPLAWCVEQIIDKPAHLRTDLEDLKSISFYILEQCNVALCIDHEFQSLVNSKRSKFNILQHENDQKVVCTFNHLVQPELVLDARAAYQHFLSLRTVLMQLALGVELRKDLEKTAGTELLQSFNKGRY